MLSLVSWKMLLLNWTNSLHESDQLTPTKLHVSHSHLFQVWVLSGVSAPALAGMCCPSLYVSLPLGLAPLLPRIPDSPLVVPAPAPESFTSPACLPAGSNTQPGDRIPPQCHLLWTKRLSLTLTVTSFQDSYLLISLVSVWISFYVEFKPEVHSAQTVKYQPYSPLPWLMRLHIIIIQKKLLQRWIHSIQAFLFIYPGALWSCGSLYLIMGDERGSYPISWCTLLRSGFSFCVWGRRVQFLEAQLFNFNILQVQE